MTISTSGAMSRLPLMELAALLFCSPDERVKKKVSVYFETARSLGRLIQRTGQKAGCAVLALVCSCIVRAPTCKPDLLDY